MWNCCGYNANTRSTTTQNTNGLTNGVFGYFIPVNYNGTTSCCRRSCSDSCGVSRCGNGVFVTVACGGSNRACLQSVQSTQGTQNTQIGCGCSGNISTVNDCYYARQYGLCGNAYSGCGYYSN